MSFIIQNDPEFYPKGAGPVAARRLRNAAAGYRALSAALDKELEAAEQAFVTAFAANDVVQSARDRLAQMASKSSRKNRDLNLR